MLEKQKEAWPCFQHVLYWCQALKQVLGFDTRFRGLNKIMCVRVGVSTKHNYSWALKHYLLMLWFPKIFFPQCQFFLEVLLGAPDAVLIWFYLIVISASFNVTSTLAAQERSSCPNRLDLKKKVIFTYFDSQSWATVYHPCLGLGLSENLFQTHKSIAALLMFSSLHSFKPVTSLSHFSATVGVFLSFYSLFNLSSVSPSHCCLHWSQTGGKPQEKTLHSHCYNGSNGIHRYRDNKL